MCSRARYGGPSLRAAHNSAKSVRRHRGPFIGLEPTGRSFSDVHHVYLFRVRDGKVTEYKAVRDDVSLMRQLGQVPQAA
jgi:predicted ester cyclase